MKKQPWRVLPEDFLDRLGKIFPEEYLLGVLESFCTRKPTTFRTNRLKISSEKLKEKLTNQHIPYEEISWYKGAFILKNISQRLLMDTDLYTQGLLYIQSLSSMIAPLVLNPQENESILDICAAPGSKTSQIAAIMNNTGTIVANDKSRIRLYKLQANLKLLGVTNTKVLELPGQILWRQYPEYFDKSLVDVPCSLEGRFLIDDPKSYREWSVKKIRSLVQIQRFLLRSAVSATKPGGSIVYSTCTLAPEENEGIIDWILKKEKGAVQVETIDFEVPAKLPGRTNWNERVYHPDISKTIRILPSVLMEGFYIAKLKKVQSTITKPNIYTDRSSIPIINRDGAYERLCR